MRRAYELWLVCKKSMRNPILFASRARAVPQAAVGRTDVVRAAQLGRCLIRTLQSYADGDIDALRREIEAGVPADCESSEGTPLQILCTNTTFGFGYDGTDGVRLECVRVLLAQGAAIEFAGESALCRATVLGDRSLVDVLIAAGGDPRWADEDGWTALHAAAAFGSARHASCAVALLEAGADVHARFYDDEEGRLYTPLLQAVYNARGVHILAVLVSSGATYDMGNIQLYGYPSGLCIHPRTIIAVNDAGQPTYGYKAAPKYGDTDYPDGGYLARVALAVDGTTCWPKVADGGWKRYEQAHRRQLVSMFVPKLRLPADVLSLVVEFWAHIGYY